MSHFAASLVDARWNRERRMILGYHCIFGTYGFWLPNDPRGSGSDYVASWELYRYGPATKTVSRRSVAGAPHDRSLRQQAKTALHSRPVLLTEHQAAIAVEGFAEACREGGYVAHACAVLADHVHLVIGRHHREIRRIVGHLKRNATLALKHAGHFPHPDQPVWGEHGWNVFLDDVAAVQRAVGYVVDNPAKEGRPRQHWAFVTPFECEPRGDKPRG